MGVADPPPRPPAVPRGCSWKRGPTQGGTKWEAVRPSARSRSLKAIRALPRSWRKVSSEGSVRFCIVPPLSSVIYITTHSIDFDTVHFVTETLENDKRQTTTATTTTTTATTNDASTAETQTPGDTLGPKCFRIARADLNGSAKICV